MYDIKKFQSFCQYRAKLVKKGQNAPPNVLEDIHMLKQNNDVRISVSRLTLAIINENCV